MRQEFQQHEESEEAPTVLSLPSQIARWTAARNQAQAYLARLAPILYSLQTDDPAECEHALKTVMELRANGGPLLNELEQTAELGDEELVTTFRAAVTQSGAIEDGLRRRLAVLRPGSPEGRVDLAALRAGLAQVAARQELTEATGTTFADEERVEVPLSRANWATGAGMLLGGLAMGSFVTIHATLFIGGFSRVIGAFALFFLLFYALFYAAVFSLFANALAAISDENLTIEGRELVVRSTVGGWTREKRRTLGPNSRAALVLAQMRAKGQQTREIAMVDAEGREFRFGRFVPEPVKQATVERINRYVKRVTRA